MVNLDSKFYAIHGSNLSMKIGKMGTNIPNDIKVPVSKYERRWGTWSGEAIGYVINR